MFLYHKWLQLNITTRHKIAAQFSIQKKGSTEVVDNQIKNDGYAIKEIEEALNIDAIQEYLGVSETDMMTLWLWLIDKIEGRQRTQVNIDTTLTGELNRSNEVVEKSVDKERMQKFETKNKRGRPTKAK